MASGGIRSIVQLTILHELEKLIDLDMPISNFFDLIIGTRCVCPMLSIILNANRDIVAAELWPALLGCSISKPNNL